MYKVNVHCENCGARERVTIYGGERVTQTLCPVCGCKTLSLDAIPNPELIKDRGSKC